MEGRNVGRPHLALRKLIMYAFDAGVDKDIFLLVAIEKSEQAGSGELSQDGSVKTASTVSKLFQNVPEHSSMFWTFVPVSYHCTSIFDVRCHFTSFFDVSCHSYCSLMTAVILIILCFIVLQIHVEDCR
jgi:hypothetical protein